MRTLLALAPVLLFLVELWVIDSYKLVRPTTVVSALAAGAAAALLSTTVDPGWLVSRGVSETAFSRYVAPVVEEALKACALLFFMARGRIGFVVDAAILGFAVGAGFALVENIHYLWSLPGASLLLWLVRGFGAAVLHGGTTSIFAMIAKTLADRRGDRLWLAAPPGFALAVLVHSIFNHTLLSALAETLVVLVVLPLVVLWMFARSERTTREWVGAGLDLDLELLELVRSERFASSRAGRYLHRLRDRLPATTIVDAFCLLRLELEISIQAKALLLAREAGVELSHDSDRAALLAELGHLQRSIGKAAMLALEPLRLTSRRDRWHRFLLEAAAP